MPDVHYGICNLCDATCGLEIVVEGREVLSIKGDRENPFSRGYVCPKSQAHKDLYNDPDRLRHPVRRRGDSWEAVSWDEAIGEASERLAAVQRKHGDDALALYWGDPVAHNYATQFLLLPFIKALKTKSVFTVNSVDSLPRMLVSMFLYGNQAAVPVPDIERTDFLLILGANPLVSNGSAMTASDCRKRLARIRERGGRIVVVDPRRTETAAVADAHHFIRPGADALFLAAILHAGFEEGFFPRDRVLPRVDGIGALRDWVRPFPPERVSGAAGIPADAIRGLARDFAAAPSAVCYGRMGTCTQEFGAAATWLIDALNVVSGNFDRSGGAMFTTPPVDLARLAKVARQTGHFDRWRSRVGNLPEFNGELPVAALAQEIETPGPGQVKALVTLAGNLCLSRPNSGRLLRAMKGLEYMVSIDLYVNETTRHADLILPPVSSLEEDHFETIMYTLAVRNAVNYAPPVFPKPADARQDWEILLDLASALQAARGPLGVISGWATRALFRAVPPRRQLDLLLRLGPHSLSLKKLERAPHGIDLGPLAPGVEKVLHTRGSRIDLVPAPMAEEADRLRQRLEATPVPGDDSLVLIGRRALRGLNSWLHNCPSVHRDGLRFSLLMHPDDAARRGLADGRTTRVWTATGEIEAPLEVTDGIMPGVVSLPHGWGHDLPGVALSEARKRPGANVNLITDDARVDAVSGTSVLYGIPVRVSGSS